MPPTWGFTSAGFADGSPRQGCLLHKRHRVPAYLVSYNVQRGLLLHSASGSCVSSLFSERYTHTSLSRWHSALLPTMAPMATQRFYLLGDDASTAKEVSLDPTFKPEEVKRAVGLVFHVAQPLGKKTNATAFIHPTCALRQRLTMSSHRHKLPLVQGRVDEPGGHHRRRGACLAAYRWSAGPGPPRTFRTASGRELLRDLPGPPRQPLQALPQVRPGHQDDEHGEDDVSHR